METNRAVLTFITDFPEDLFTSTRMEPNDRVFWNEELHTTWMFFTVPHPHIRVFGDYNETDRIRIDRVK